MLQGMSDRGELQVPDFAVDLMSELNAKRLKQAEGTLLIDEGTPPWLLNVLCAISGSPAANEQAFLAIVFTLLYEAGYYFVEGPRNDSITYDVRVMRELNDSQALLNIIKKDKSQHVAIFSHKLMHPKTLKVIAYSVPHTIQNPVIINFLLADQNKVDSFVYNTKLSVNCIGPNKEHIEFVKFGCRDLSVEIKTYLHSIKSCFGNETYHPHHILFLPPHILQSLCKYMDSLSFVRFTQTCKFLYEAFSDDETIWKYFSLNEHRGLTKKPTETWKAHFKYQNSKTPKFFTCGVYGSMIW